jgi:hypothetical protein
MKVKKYKPHEYIDGFKFQAFTYKMIAILKHKKYWIFKGYLTIISQRKKQKQR